MSAPLYDAMLRKLAEDVLFGEHISQPLLGCETRFHTVAGALPVSERELRAIARHHAARKVVLVTEEGEHVERSDDGGRAPTLCLAGVEGSIPSLGAFVAHAKEVVGTPGRMLVNAYQSEDAQGFGLHLDAQHVWIIQIDGQKRWRFGHRSAWPKAPRNMLHDELRSLALADMVDGPALPQPGALLSRTLRPGDVLYLPRGTWHETAADGPSLSLSLTFVPDDLVRSEEHAADRRWLGTPRRRGEIPSAIAEEDLLTPGPLPPPQLVTKADQAGVFAYFGPERVLFANRERLLVTLLGRTAIRVGEALSLSRAVGVSDDAVRRACGVFLSRGAVHVA